MPARPCRLIFALLAGGAGGVLAAAETPATVVAVQVRGTVEVLHDLATTAEAVAEGDQFVTADTITTAARSSVTLVLPNGSLVALKEKSRLKIAVALHSPAVAETLAANGADPREPGTSQTGFELAFGQMLTRVRKLNPTSTFTVQTPVSVAAVRGTVFEVAYQPDAKGGAHYNLSTSSGLVHVTPHAGKMVAVSGNQQLDFAAELGQGGVRIKNLKSSKLARQKQQQIEQEAADHEHAAGEFMQRAKAPGTGAKAQAAAAGHLPESAADRSTPGSGTMGAAPGGNERSTGPAATTTKSVTPTAKTATPAANTPANSTNRATAPATNPAPTVAKPATPAPTTAKPVTKPNTLPKPIKRPPRPPGG